MVSIFSYLGLARSLTSCFLLEYVFSVFHRDVSRLTLIAVLLFPLKLYYIDAIPMQAHLSEDDPKRQQVVRYLAMRYTMIR